MVDGDAARAGMCVVYICVSVCMFMCVTVRDYMFTCMCMCVLVMVSGGSRNRTMGGSLVVQSQSCAAVDGWMTSPLCEKW